MTMIFKTLLGYLRRNPFNKHFEVSLKEKYE